MQAGAAGGAGCAEDVFVGLGLCFKEVLEILVCREFGGDD